MGDLGSRDSRERPATRGLPDFGLASSRLFDTHCMGMLEQTGWLILPSFCDRTYSNYEKVRRVWHFNHYVLPRVPSMWFSATPFRSADRTGLGEMIPGCGASLVRGLGGIGGAIEKVVRARPTGIDPFLSSPSPSPATDVRLLLVPRPTMEFPTLRMLVKKPKAKSRFGNQSQRSSHRVRDCTPEQTKAFDVSYNEVKDIAARLYENLAGDSSGAFSGWDVGQLEEFFGDIGTEENRRNFGLVRLSMWDAMRTSHKLSGASLIVDEKMCIGRKFLGARSVRTMIWWKDGLWRGSCCKTKGFSSTIIPPFTC